MTPLKPVSKRIAVATIALMVFSIVYFALGGLPGDDVLRKFILSVVGLAGIALLIFVEVTLPNIRTQGAKIYLLNIVVEVIFLLILGAAISFVAGFLKCA